MHYIAAHTRYGARLMRVRAHKTEHEGFKAAALAVSMANRLANAPKRYNFGIAPTGNGGMNNGVPNGTGGVEDVLGGDDFDLNSSMFNHRRSTMFNSLTDEERDRLDALAAREMANEEADDAMQKYVA
jgi:hypothetical protein